VIVSGALLVSAPPHQILQTGLILVENTNAIFQVEEERRPMSYTQTFQLLPNNEGSYFVFNDVFRLVYPAA